MCRKLIVLISVVLVLGLLNGASAKTFTWTNADAADSNWCTDGNWDRDNVPGSDDTALIDWSSPERGPIIGIGCDAEVLLIQGPEPNFGMVQVMDVNTSGTVETDAWIWRRDVEGVGTGTAIININGSPTITIDGLWRGTDNGISIVNIDGDPCIIVTGTYRGGDNSGWFCTNMSGGYFEVQDEFIIGDNGGGEINVSGGTIVVDHLGMGGDRGTAALIINMTGGLILVEGEFMFPGSHGRGGNIWMNLDGGVMDCNEFLHGGEDGGDPSYTDDWRVDIEQGVLKISGDVVDIIDANVVAGQITAYDDEGTVVVVYDDVNDKTVVSGLPPDPNTATDPNPGNRSTGVDPNIVLSWTAGVNATDHLVFFGTSWDDVETMTDPCAIKLLGDETYDPNGSGPLCKGTTYYWRVDANNPTTTWTGRIWYFTVKSPIVDPNMLVHYKFDEPNGVVAYDSSGREYHGAVDGAEDLWDPNNGHRDGCRIFDVDGDAETLVDVPAAVTSTIDRGITISVWLKDSYNDEENWVCNIGAGGEGAPYHLLVDVGGDHERAYFRAGDDSCDVLTWDLDGHNARDIEEWHHWAFVKDENIDTMSMYFDGELKATKTDAHDTLANLQNTTFKIGALTWEYFAYAGKIDEFKVFDYGKSAKEVQALFREEGLEFAWGPHPFDGEKDADYDVVCTWSRGDYADSHDVYFGTNWDDIKDVNSSNLASYPNVEYNHTDACSYDPCGLLDLDQTFYWRVDEVNDACDPNGWKGRVWKFTVADYITIDDFEDDTAQDPPSKDWHQIGSAGITLRSTPPVIGKHSMRYAYLNSFDFDPGYYSEIESISLEPNDWTGFELKLLSLWFYGQSGNAATITEQMYVFLKDNDGNDFQVKYGDAAWEDMTDVQIEDWQEWLIPLSRFSTNDVNLANLDNLCIGFGIRGWGDPAGSGVVYFDNIQLHPGRCIPSLRAPPEADLNNDCVVDYEDVEIMADEWLEVDVNLSPVQPPSEANLVGWWKLDDGAGSIVTDYAGYDNNGVIETLDVNAWWVSGYDGNALEFDGGRVRVPDTVALRSMQQVSVCAWVYYSDEQDSARVVVKGADNKECYEIEIGDDDQLIFMVRDGNDYDAGDDEYEKYAAESNEAENPLDRNEWIHVAGTYDGNSVRCYINGELMDKNDDPNNEIPFLCQDTNDLAIGNRSDDKDHGFTGKIDDVRVYKYALSAEEVAYIATDETGIFTVHSAANLYNLEDLGKRSVNLRDWTEFAKGWLEKKFWPE